MTPYQVWEKKMNDDYPKGMMEEIRKFFRDDHPWIVNRPYEHVVDEVFGSEAFFPLQRKAEMQKMLEMANDLLPTVVMEIGADKGGGLYHWCLLPTVKSVIACEIRGLPYRDEFEKAFPHIHFLWLETSSYSPTTVQTVQDFLTFHDERRIDVLFIDGDKGHMKDDFALYKHLVRSPGGLVFVHDVQDDVPGRQFMELYPAYKGEIILDKSEGIEAAERVKNGEQPKNPHDAWLAHWFGRSCGVGVLRL